MLLCQLETFVADGTFARVLLGPTGVILPTWPVSLCLAQATCPNCIPAKGKLGVEWQRVRELASKHRVWLQRTAMHAGCNGAGSSRHRYSPQLPTRLWLD